MESHQPVFNFLTSPQVGGKLDQVTIHQQQ
jgi:hypothetical protein